MSDGEDESTSTGFPRSSPLATPLLPVVSVLALVGCGGGLPLLHPAKTLPTGEVRAVAGFSGNATTGSLSDAVRDATNKANLPGPPGTDATYARAALVVASVAPGLAPIVGARVGVGAQAEGGLAYTGRSIRVDLRRSFYLSPNWALSIGAGGSAALYGRQGGTSLPGVDLGRLHGWGADVPLLVGYRSDGDLYMVWLGARGGWEHVDVSAMSSVPGGVTFGSPSISLSATRCWGGGLVGLAIGFRHLHVAMELDVSYATVTGDYGGTHASVGGLTLAPASALWWRF
jgi:hypothetical protein